MKKVDNDLHRVYIYWLALHHETPIDTLLHAEFAEIFNIRAPSWTVEELKAVLEDMVTSQQIELVKRGEIISAEYIRRLNSFENKGIPARIDSVFFRLAPKSFVIVENLFKINWDCFFSSEFEINGESGDFKQSFVASRCTSLEVIADIALKYRVVRYPIVSINICDWNPVYWKTLARGFRIEIRSPVDLMEIPELNALCNRLSEGWCKHINEFMDTSNG